MSSNINLNPSLIILQLNKGSIWSTTSSLNWSNPKTPVRICVETFLDASETQRSAHCRIGSWLFEQTTGGAGYELILQVLYEIFSGFNLLHVELSGIKGYVAFVWLLRQSGQLIWMSTIVFKA